MLAGAGGRTTVPHGTRQSVTVTSNAPGAAVTVLTAEPGKTPIVRSRPGVTPIDLDLTRRNGNIALRVEKDG